MSSNKQYSKELTSRLMAVQACYEISHNAKSVRQIIQETLEHGDFIDIDGEELPKPHSGLFKKILISLDDRLVDINEIVEANINRKAPAEVIESKENSIDSEETETETETEIEIEVAAATPEKEIEPLLKSILLCGVTELLSHQDIDAPIIIDDYLNVTHAFYEKQQVSFVNGILDKVASNLR